MFLLGSCLFRCLLCCPLDGETQIWLGICVLPCVFGGVFFSFMICHAACDHLRPCRSFLFNSFFSCKDRASERDRPYRRKKIPYVATLRSGRTQCMKRHFFINSSCQSATFVSSLRGKKIWKFSTQSKKQLAKMQQKKNVQWVVLMTEVPFPKPAIDALQGSAKPAGRGHASDAKRVGTEQRHAATLKLEVFGNCPQRCAKIGNCRK